jgi:hypothetical protein
MRSGMGVTVLLQGPRIAPPTEMESPMISKRLVGRGGGATNEAPSSI